MIRFIIEVHGKGIIASNFNPDGDTMSTDKYIFTACCQIS